MAANSGARGSGRVEVPAIAWHTATIHLVSGGVAGVVSRTVTAPLDRIKLIMQVSTSRPLSIVSTFNQIRAEGTFKAFFRGNWPNCLKIGPESAMRFYVYDFCKRRFMARKTHPSTPNTSTPPPPIQLSFTERLLSGGIAGCCAQFLIYPLEIAKTRLATLPPHTYHSITDCLIDTYRKERIKGLYKGLLPSLLGIFPYAGIDLSVFETLKKRLQLRTGEKDLSPLSLLTCGALSSSIGQVVSYPIALVRTRMQADGYLHRHREYKSMMDVFRKTYSREGFFGLYKGIGPNMLKTVPAVSISWVIYENSKHFLSGWFQEEEWY